MPGTHPLNPVGPNPLAAPPIRWGVLAPGGIAESFARDVLTHTTSSITAVGSRSYQRAHDFATRFKIPRAYGSYDDLLADNAVDAVYIASPHSHHFRHASAAIHAGKHVLVEKTFTHNATEARSLFALAQDAGVHVMEAMWTRFLPQFYTLRALLARNVIGKIVHVYATLGQPVSHKPRVAQPELAGGALLDLGVYPVSFTHHVLGPPCGVQASGLLSPTGVDETVGVTLTYPKAVATLSTTMVARAHNIAEITGTRGRITLSDAFYRPDSTLTVHPLNGPPYTLASPVEGGYQFQAAEVARNIHAEVLQSPLMPWQDTLEVMGTLDEIRRQLGVHFPGEQRC